MACSERRELSKKFRKRKAYAKLYERYARIDAVRDRGDHRRWSWIAFPESIGTEPDTFEPTVTDGDITYAGHWAFDPAYGRVFVVDDTKYA